ncbi:hypothetical protein [Polaromonas sp. C04]|uniref:hypothetical protein n=1 Tax=Polaromonas sp. C04 TaxID=1945857 RepID=UPI0009CA194D|nr:hypothetical protein [Polaromonas sp. C04]OOG57453.1 hypothetical protein B0E49_05065 [Polaromonas sp. C04]
MIDSEAEQRRTDRAIKAMIARFDVAGHLVRRGPAGDFMVFRMGVRQYCRDFEALQAHARECEVTE